MSNRSANHVSHEPGGSVAIGNPYEAALRWNSQAFSAYSTIGCEAHDFLARRFNEDFALVRRIAQCRAPNELVVAYTEFWRKAAEDYGKEATTIAKLMINTASKMNPQSAA